MPTAAALRKAGASALHVDGRGFDVGRNAKGWREIQRAAGPRNRDAPDGRRDSIQGQSPQRRHPTINQPITQSPDHPITQSIESAGPSRRAGRRDRVGGPANRAGRHAPARKSASARASRRESRAASWRAGHSSCLPPAEPNDRRTPAHRGRPPRGYGWRARLPLPDCGRSGSAACGSAPPSSAIACATQESSTSSRLITYW